MNVTTLVEAPLVGVVEIRHPRGEAHRDPPEEIAADYSINFVDRGGFDLHVGRQQFRISRGTLLVARPRLVLRFRHGEEIPMDVCTSIRFHEGSLPDSLERRKGKAVIPLTNRLAYLRWRLRRATEDGDPVEVEVVGGQIAEALPPEGDAPRHRFRESQLAWYLPRVDRSRELMGERYAESISLALLASEAGMSPFHFARVFRELAGIPPHRYLLRVRLGRAAQLLREGMSVTEACYASGYSNLSHFIRTFSRAYGAAPSRFAGLR